MPANIFISYSHSDGHLVAPLVKLLRINADYVFQDTDSLIPGKKWREQIEDNLKKADLFILFWCEHSSKSEEVAIEYEAAKGLDKDILPVLLDRTELPLDLKEFQWIDFRSFESHSEKMRFLNIKEPTLELLTRSELLSRISDDMMASDLLKEIDIRLAKEALSAIRIKEDARL
jgi:hypothetical protein